MRKRALVVALALGAPAAFMLPFAGNADAQKAAAKPSASAAASSDRYDPDNVRAISQSMEMLVSGNEKYLAKDFNGAIDIYKKAIALKPRDPFGPYLLGEAYLATKNLPEAEAAFKQAEELSDSKNPALRSHILFCVADIYERERKMEQARAAWQNYNEQAPKVPDGGAFPQAGADRLKVVEAWLKLDKQYEVVRARIAAEKDAGSGAAPAASAKPKK